MIIEAIRRRTATLVSLVVGVLTALLIGAILVLLSGASPLTAYQVLFDGSFGSKEAFGETLIRFVPLAVIAAALAPALQARLYNVGSPGQFAMGAFAGTLVSLYFRSIPGPLLILLAAFAGAFGGLVWGAIPALLRAYANVNEILSTLAFNFLSSYFLLWLLNKPFRGGLANIPQSDALPQQAWLPIIVPETRAHVGVIIALALLVMLSLFRRSSSGYRVRLLGANRTLALHAGVSESRSVFVLMSLAAAGAGLAGWLQVAGVDHRLYAFAAVLVGFNGLFVAIVGRMSAVGILVAGLFFGALSSGGNLLQVGANVPVETAIILQALVLLAVVVAEGKGQ